MIAQKAVWLTTGDVARMLGTTRRTVYDWVNAGVVRGGVTVRLAGEWIGARLKFTPESVAAFRRACNGQARPPAEAPRRDEELRAKLARRKPGRKPGSN